MKRKLYSGRSVNTSYENKTIITFSFESYEWTYFLDKPRHSTIKTPTIPDKGPTYNCKSKLISIQSNLFIQFMT